MKLTNRVKTLTATFLIVAAGGSAYAIQQVTTSGAEEPHPIIEHVEDHELRIGTLEDRADETDAKVERNSDDVEAIRQQVGASASAPAPTEAPSSSQPSSSPSGSTAEPAAPTPAPEPPKNPRLITGVTDTPGKHDLHTCDYTLHDPKQNVTVFIQPVSQPCYAVGEVLPYV